MKLFRHNELINVDMAEDDPRNIRAVQPINDTMIRDRIYELKHEREGYIFRVTQSPWEDNSGIGYGLNGHYSTIGDAISSALRSDKAVWKDETRIFLPNKS